MRCAVVGAGAWGLPAATELASRGHEVVLLDRYGIGNAFASSHGPTRIWRLTHPDPVRVRLARRAVEAMQRLGSRSGRQVFVRSGLLWRDDVSLGPVVDALTAESVDHTVVDPAEVGRYFPQLRSDGRAAVWQADAGSVLAAESMAAHAELFAQAGGRAFEGAIVRTVDTTAQGVRIGCEDGSSVSADVVVLAPGPGAQPLLRELGIELPLDPVLAQVVHVQPADDLPCLFDGPTDERPGLYALPTPGHGYKVGLDTRVRDWVEADDDRRPDPAATAAIVERVRSDLPALDPRVVDAELCCMTHAPDGRFVIDRLDDRVVVACGDSGEGFKFSALMGPVLADLAEGHAPDADVAAFGLGRFADGVTERQHVLGR